MFLISLLIWFLIFSTTYNFGINIYIPLVISIFSIFHTSNYKGIEVRFYFILIALCSFWFVASLFVNSADLEIVLVVFRFIFKSLLLPLISILLLVGLLRKYSVDMRSLSYIVIGILLFQLLFSFIQLSIPSFRIWFASHIELADNWRLLVEHGNFRATGLSGISIYDTSVAYALLMPLLKPAVSSRYLLDRLFGMLGIIATILLCMLGGRSGLLLLIPMLMYLYIANTHRKFFLFFFLGFAALAFIGAIIVIGWDLLYVAFRFIFEPFYSFYETGTFSSKSTSHFMDDYLFIPWEVSPIFGDGFWAQPSLAMKHNYKYITDSGFLLFFIAFGSVGLILGSSWVVYYCWVIDRLIKKDVLFVFRLLLMIMISAYMFFLMLKAPFIISERLGHTLAFLISVLIHKKEMKI
jgi:hypothetical protein